MSEKPLNNRHYHPPQLPPLDKRLKSPTPKDTPTKGLDEIIYTEMYEVWGLNANDTEEFDEANRNLKRAITELFERAIPEKFPEVGVTQNQIDFARGYNQAIDDFNKRLEM